MIMFDVDSEMTCSPMCAGMSTGFCRDLTKSMMKPSNVTAMLSSGIRTTFRSSGICHYCKFKCGIWRVTRLVAFNFPSVRVATFGEMQYCAVLLLLSNHFSGHKIPIVYATANTESIVDRICHILPSLERL